MAALAIVSTVVSALGAISQANAASDAADYNAQIATQNAQIAQQQGQAAAAAQDKAARQKIGLMVANYGASGIDVGSGSPLDILRDSASTAKLDNLTTLYNYQLKSQGYTNTATLDSMQSDAATTSGYLSAAGTALGGASKAFSYAGTGNELPDSLTYGYSTTAPKGVNAFL